MTRNLRFPALIYDFAALICDLAALSIDPAALICDLAASLNALAAIRTQVLRFGRQFCIVDDRNSALWMVRVAEYLFSCMMCSMQLTNEQYAYFNLLSQARYHAIIRQFQAEFESIGFCFDEITQQRTGQIMVSRIKKLAKDIIESRSEAYIETCRKFIVFPDGEDLEAFINEAKPYVMTRVRIL